MHLFAVPFIKPRRHPGDDFCAPVVQHQKLPALLIKREPFDLTLPDHIIKCLFQTDLTGSILFRQVNPVHMVRRILPCIPVIACQIQASLKAGDALQPFRARLHPKLPPVLPCIQVIHVQSLTGFVIDPGGQIDRSGIRIHCDAAALHLAGIGAERKDPLQLQRVPVVDGNLDVFPIAILKVFHAQIQFIIVHVNVADMVDFQRIACKRVPVFGNKRPAAVVFFQRP